MHQMRQDVSGKRDDPTQVALQKQRRRACPPPTQNKRLRSLPHGDPRKRHAEPSCGITHTHCSRCRNPNVGRAAVPPTHRTNDKTVAVAATRGSTQETRGTFVCHHTHASQQVSQSERRQRCCATHAPHADARATHQRVRQMTSAAHARTLRQAHSVNRQAHSPQWCCQ
jgi:hypothetical protein